MSIMRQSSKRRDRVTVVTDPHQGCVDLQEAARMLHMRVWRVRWIRFNDHLSYCRFGCAGLPEGSVAAELEWRARTPLWRRLARAIGDVLSYVS